MIAVSPRLGELLIKVAQTPDLEAALWKVVNEYIELKINSLKEQVKRFEQKWGMSFEEFSRRCKDGSLDVDPYSWEVERDFWEWERAETLLRHYETLKF